MAGKDLTADLTWSDIMLQETEAMICSLAILDEILSTTGKLPPARGDVEGQTMEVTFFLDDTIKLIISADSSDLCFAEWDNVDDIGKHLGRPSSTRPGRQVQI